MKTEKISMGLIQENKYNPNEMDENKFKKLVLNIKRKGFRKPIEVRKVGQKYIIIDGAHRFKACKELGHTEIDCIIDEVDETEAMVDTLNANIHGSHNPYKEAQMFKKINQRYQLQDIEKLTVYDQSVIKDRLELLGLPDSIKRELEERQQKEREEAPVVLSFIVKEPEKQIIMSAINQADDSDNGKALVEICQAFLSFQSEEVKESEEASDGAK